MTNTLITKWLDNQNNLTKQTLTKYVMRKRWYASKEGIFKFIEDTDSGLYFVYFGDYIVATYDSEDETYRFTDHDVALNLVQLNDLLETGKNF